MSRRNQILFLAALLGLLAAVGTLVGDLLGGWAALAYAVAAVGLVLVGAARARAAQARRQEAAGRTCSCCTGTQFDPVEVV